MIDFVRMDITDFAAHYVPNKVLGDNLNLSETPFQFTDDHTKNTITLYLTTNFKNDIYYQFKNIKNEFHYHDVKSYVKQVFDNKSTFFETSKELSKHLFNASMHPKIKGGELYFAYMKDVMVDGEICDAIGIFKSETKDTYIKTDTRNSECTIEVDYGMSLKKLDRGVIIYNLDSENGYKANIVDNGNKVADCSFYWVEDFLNMTLKKSAYYHTSNLMQECIGFSEEILTEENNVTKENQKMFLNNSIKYFKDNDIYSKDHFEKEILISPSIIEAFSEYDTKFRETYDLGTSVEEFPISKTALKEKKKFMTSIMKFDKNFELHIKGKHDWIEKGFDEEKGMKFCKVYYANES